MENYIKKDKYVGYEYLTVNIKKEYMPLYIDSYENFGWIYEAMENVIQPVGNVNIKFKRDRKIKNKAELTRLQRQFDSLVEQIVHIEKSKTSFAFIAAFVIAIIGCAFMAGSVFAITFTINIPLMIILAIPGIICWVLPYFVYSRIRKNKINMVTPLIEAKYDEIYEVTKRASSLLDL